MTNPAPQHDHGSPRRSSSPALGAAPAKRVYLAVPFEEKDQARALGARWDKEQRVWYVGDKAGAAALDRWRLENRPVSADALNDAYGKFADFLLDLGFELNADPKKNHPIMDSKRHRAPTQGDKKGETSGVYRAYLDGRPAGYAQNYRTGEIDYWKADDEDEPVNEEGRAQRRAEMAARRAEREAEQAATFKASAEFVQRQLRRMMPVIAPTPYHERKGIEVVSGAYQDEDGVTLFVPAYDVHGYHWTTQYIDEDGGKRFKKDSRKEGCFHVIGGMAALQRAEALVICEGYATGASITQSMNMPTVSAFDAGNLKIVAEALAARFPDKPVLIAGDDDQRVLIAHGRNPGVEKATAAALAAGAAAVFPRFAEGEQEGDPGRFTDFNDLAQNSRLGGAALSEQIREGLREAGLIHVQLRDARTPAARHKSSMGCS